MTEELRKQVERLLAVAPRLNAATDEANRVAQPSRELLNEELSLGISAKIGTSTPGPATRRTRPSTPASPTAAWRASTASTSPRSPTRTSRATTGYNTQEISRQDTPWSSCPREVKLKAFEGLPDLLYRIANDAEEMATAADATAKTVAEMLDAMGGTNVVEGGETAPAEVQPRGELGMGLGRRCQA